MRRPERAELACELLLDAGAPAGHRLHADSGAGGTLAAELPRHFPTAAYHAGLDAEHRQRVQEEFLAGRIEVMVATIAFGMGIDKPDMRTVIHTALAGEPGGVLPGDRTRGPRRKTKPRHPDALLRRSPHARFLLRARLPGCRGIGRHFSQLASEPQEKSALQKQLRMNADIFDKALEKLWIHGGAVLDFAENVSRGQPQWRESYIAHGEQKQAQIDLMIRFAESNQCRMSTLVRHFGDLADGETACGICDFCAPAQCAAQRFRTATEAEHAALFRVIAALRAGDTRSTGKLHGELCPDGAMSRDAFEEVLGAMARAGLVRFSDAVFEKDGKQIPYRQVSLTRAAHAVDEQTPIGFIIKDLAPASATGKNKKRAATPEKWKGSELPTKVVRQKPVLSAQHAGSYSRIEAALREWRLTEARRRQVPAFRIFSDRVLKAMASRRPGTARELLGISGIGMTTVERYGQQIYRIVKDNSG